MSNSEAENTDSVASLWRYPVKSMMGEELNSAEVGASGIRGDRAYALVDDESGQVVSAKNPKKWPDFFYYRAAYVSPLESAEVLPPVWITLPDGKVVRSDHSEINAALSQALRRSVSLKSQAPLGATLEQFHPESEEPAVDGTASEPITAESIALDAPGGSFFDYAMLHLLTTATLEHLRELYPQGRFEARRFRPNIVIGSAPGEKGFVENDWVGRVVTIGEEVKLEVTDPCPRCVMTTLAQGDLPKDPGILRSALHNSVFVPFAGKPLPSIGVYARVLQGGTIRRGDRLTIL